MADENDSGQDPAEIKKDGSQGGGRNRRWRRRGSSNRAQGMGANRPEEPRGQDGQAEKNAARQQGQPGRAQGNTTPKNPNNRQPDGNPQNRNSRKNRQQNDTRPAYSPQGDGGQGNPQGRDPQGNGQQRRKPFRGRGNQPTGQPQNTSATTAQQSSRSQTPGPADGQQKPQGQPSQRQERRRQDNRRARSPQNTPAGQESNQDRGQQGQNQRQGQRPSQNRDGQGKANPSQGRRTPRQNTPTGSTTRRRSNTSSERSQSAYRQGQPFASSTPIKARGGIKARSSDGGEFGKNWWAKRWLSAMERLMDGARLQRGRRYARMGQVLSMNEVNGDVVAKVQGSRPAPYKVTIAVSPLSDEQWNQVLDVLAGRAIFTAQLLAGEMPPTIEEAFSAAGVSLFPARGGDLHTECSCPDWANPCKHIAATQYILADRFDEDPFLLFRMRGRTQESILQALRLRRTGSEAPLEQEPQTEEEPAPPLEPDINRFWDMGSGLEDYSVNVQQPQIALPLFKRLGEPDVARGHSLEETLGPALDVISQTALFLAFTDTSREPGENGDSA